MTKDSAWLDAILTDDFNPWFPGSEYGKDTLEEAKEKILKHIEEVEERTLADCAEHCDKRVAEARVEELRQLLTKNNPDEWKDPYHWYVEWGEIADRIKELKSRSRE